MPDYTNPCNTCGSPCAEECHCPEPIYSSLGCKEPIAFACVKLESGAGNSTISYPCLPFTTGQTLFQLMPILNAWKCEHDLTKNKVKVSSADTTAGYLSQKIVTGECVTFQIINQGGNEQLRPVIDWNCMITKISQQSAFCIAVNNCGLVTCPAGTDLEIS